MSTVRGLAAGAFSISVLLLFTFIPLSAQENPPSTPYHFVFFGRDRDRLSDSTFTRNPDVAGAQVKYTWRELEPARDQYDFSHVVQDIALLKSHRKRLFIQLQDVSFSEEVRFAPEYLLSDPVFNGGVARKYDSSTPSDEDARFDGMVVRRWDPAVLDRLAKLLTALGRALDGQIEGIAISETSISFGESGRFHPVGFSYSGYAESIKSMMSAARAAFSSSHVVIYANFMPGEDPERRIAYLRAVYEHAERTGVGVGGPDILPNRPFQRRNSLPLIAARNPAIIGALAVQDGNLADRKPNGERVTVAELYWFAADTLRLDYIFWGIEEPYYSAEVLPFLRRLRAPEQPE